MNKKSIRPYFISAQKACFFVVMMTIVLGNCNKSIAGTSNIYAANKEDLKTFFESIMTRTGKGVIVSKTATRKQLNGKFDVSNPEIILTKLSMQMGLIWYSDENVIYIYDASEMKTTLFTLQNIGLSELNKFLKETGIYDGKYKVRGGSNGTFYVSGPPVYVDLILNAARSLERNSDNIEIGRQKIGIIHLLNTFVTDRTYELRNEKVTIPGISTILSELLNVKNENKKNEITSIGNENSNNTIEKMPPLPSAIEDKFKREISKDVPAIFSTNEDINITAYPGNNTILVKGTHSQVEFIRKLVKSLDIPKRHIELSLWIIDINKTDLENLGADWQGSLNIGSKVSMSFNQSSTISTLDGTKFIANIQALEQKKRASVISRPVILTQENIPAIFDNNRSFYTKLIGERTSSLESVTYGTMISVLPRFGRENQIELLLNIEDGNEDINRDTKTSDELPDVGRTVISTIARVPQGKSLLIGGYTKQTNTSQLNKIPLLGSIPILGRLFSYESKSDSNVVRIFLIQPREVTEEQMQDVERTKDKVASLRSEMSKDKLISDEFIDKWVDLYIKNN